MKMKTVFGVLKELKTDETRVALTPDCIAMLTQEGYEVIIEHNAGILSGFSDEQYIQSGAVIAKDNVEVWEKATVIVKVKEPQKSDTNISRKTRLFFPLCTLRLKKNLQKNF